MKTYNVKIYQPDGTYITSVNETTRLSKINFRSTVNAGQGSLSLNVVASFDSPPSWAAINNFVKIYCHDLVDGVQSEVLLFTGFISQIEHLRKGSNESMTLSVLGLGSLLALALYKDGASFDVAKSGVDPSAIATEIVDKVNASVGTSWLSYGANVVSVGTNIDYTFESQRWLKAMEKTRELSGGEYFWHIGADGELYFKGKAATATHKFNLLKDVNEIRVVNTSEGIVNDSTVDYGSGTKNATDATSISNYFKRDENKSDSNLGATAAQQLVDGVIEDKKDPKIQVTAEINSLYDIETIRPGDTCKFFGTEIGSTTLGTNMMIVSVDYRETTVSITLADDYANFGSQLTAYMGNQLEEKNL